MSLPPEILKKVKLLELSTRKLVNNLFAGEYHSAFKGQGMTFSEFREYTPGDDIRAISWPVTARTGKPFIKRFNEERELTLMLVVDVSASGSFGTKSYFKGDVIAHLAALLSFSAVKNNDPVGLILFSDQVEHFVPPKKGRGHVYRILRDLYYFKPRSDKTKISVALEYLQSMLKKRATVFLFSDFMDSGYDRALRQIGRKHDLISCVIQDAAEHDMPDIGLVELEDAETGEIFTADTSSASFRSEYSRQMLKLKEERDQLLKKSQVERIDIMTGEDFADPLIAYFRRRNKR
ncbi:MAG: DUF58 domain-containing protein [Bdellovibrionales bacterium]|nr:DUF58 domain-containing protein [Bdellovibrionales bacterium]